MLVAALFSRTLSQLLIAVIGAVTAIGGPIVTWFFRKRLSAIQVTINGRLDAMLGKLNAQDAAIDAQEAEIAELKAQIKPAAP